MQKFSKKFKTSASAVALLVVVFSVYGLRKLQAWPPIPSAKRIAGLPLTAPGRAEAISIGSRRLRRLPM